MGNGGAGFVSPGCLSTGLNGKAGVGVVAELQFFVQDAGFDHEIAHHIEICLAGCERAVGDPIHRFGEGPAQECGLLVVVEAADEIGCVFAVRLAGIEPEAGSGDAIDQGLDDFRTLVDEVLTHDKNARHVVWPIFASLKQDAAKAAEFGLRGKGLTHDERVDGVRGQGTRNVGRRHLDHLDFAGLDAPYLHSAKDQKALIGEAAGNSDGAAAHVRKGLDGSVFADHDRAAVTVAQVDDLDGNSLRNESNGQRGYDESGLYAVGDERFLDFRKALKHSGQIHLAGQRVFGNVVRYGAGELAGDGKISNDNFTFCGRLVVIEDGAPVHIEPGVQSGDE